MLLAELALAFARPIYLVSLSLSVVVVAAYFFRTAADTSHDAALHGFADTTAGWNPAPASARSTGCLPIVAGVVAIGGVLLAFDLTAGRIGRKPTAPRRDALARALERANSALPNDVQNYTITIGLDTRSGVWKLSHPQNRPG